MDRNISIVNRYKAGESAVELGREYGITPRTVQRIVKVAGASRTISESFNLAIKQGRMKYHYKPEHLKMKRTRMPDKLRFAVLKRDNFRCVLCGATGRSSHRIEVDHIDGDPSNHDEDNLRTLCDRCNKGAYSNR